MLLLNTFRYKVWRGGSWEPTGELQNFKTDHNLLIVAAVTWLKYCRYGVRLYLINQSINQSINLDTKASFQSLWIVLNWWKYTCICIDYIIVITVWFCLQLVDNLWFNKLSIVNQWNKSTAYTTFTIYWIGVFTVFNCIYTKGKE